MGYAVSMKKCPNCHRDATIATDEEYGFATEDEFEYDCPFCGEPILFNHDSVTLRPIAPPDAVIAMPAEEEGDEY